MSPFTPSPDERVLADGKCMDMHGPVAFPGHVFLTTKRVCFEPTAFNQIIGVSPWSLDLAAIRGVSLVGLDRTFVIETAEGPRRLVGIGARIVHDRLAPLLAADEPQTYEADERVLLHELAEVEVNDLLGAWGEVTVTTHRLRFRPRPMERVLWPDLAFEETNDRISSFSLTGIRRRLEVCTPARTVRFMGDVLPALYSALKANDEVKEGLVAADALEHEVWPAQLYRGPVSHPGALVLTATGLAFVATGALDSLAGVESLIDTPIARIERVSLRGRLDPRIEVHADDGRAVFACADASGRYDQIVAWLARRSAGPIRVEGAPGSGGTLGEIEEIEGVLAPWRARYSLPERPLAFTPAVGLRAASGATGWLLLDEESLVWLRGRVPGERARPLWLPLRRHRWLWDDAPPGEVHADVDGELYRWLPTAGAPFRAALAEQIQRLQRSAAHAAGADEPGEGRNRRDTYRVRLTPGTQPAVKIWVQVDGEFETLDGRLLEFSLGGFSVRTTTRLAPEVVLRVDLPGGGGIQCVQAAFVHERPLLSGEGWITGFAFLHPRPDALMVVRSTWMAFQQEEARRRRRPFD